MLRMVPPRRELDELVHAYRGRMYRRIVRKRVQALFDAVNAGDAQPVLDAFAARFEHVFLGDHALAGRRTSLTATEEWYDRLFRLLPDIEFEVHRIDVAGPPWAMIVTVEWGETNSATDGVRTHATGVHVVHLRWGRMTRLLILPDTVPLTHTLERTRQTSGGESVADALDETPGWPYHPLRSYSSRQASAAQT